MKLGFFLAKPNTYLEKEIPRNLIVKSIKPDNNGNGIVFMVRSVSNPKKSYQSAIWLNSNDLIDPTVDVKFNCNCPSFLYQYSTILAQHNALYGNASSNKLPKKNQKIFICKHLYGCMIYLMKNKSITQLKVK